MLDRKQKGPTAKRLTNLVDPIGKASTSKCGKRRPAKQWNFAAGFMTHRRREQAIVQARVVQHRIEQIESRFISSSYDVANAFPSVAHKELSRVIDEKLQTHGKQTRDTLKPDTEGHTCT